MLYKKREKNIIKLLFIIYKECKTLYIKFKTQSFYSYILETEVNSFCKQFFLIENNILNKKRTYL